MLPNLLVGIVSGLVIALLYMIFLYNRLNNKVKDMESFIKAINRAIDTLDGASFVESYDRERYVGRGVSGGKRYNPRFYAPVSEVVEQLIESLGKELKYKYPEDGKFYLKNQILPEYPGVKL